MEVEAEISGGGDGAHLDLIDLAVRIQGEAHEGIRAQLPIAPARHEGVVLPMLEVAHERGSVAEAHHERSVLEGDRNVAVPVVAIRARVAFQGEVGAGGRFIINTTFGLGGLIDVAGVAGEPKHYEDFGQTLGVWGMGPGPYFMLPLLGPSTVRDASGRLIDNLFFIPANYVRNQNITTGAFLLNSVNVRSNLLGTEKVLEEASVDRYSFLRDAYLQRRESVIYDGNPPKKKDQEFEDFDEPEKIPGSEKKN